MAYNKAIYGDPALSPSETIDRLKAENCFSNGTLMIFPEWLRAPEIFEAIDAGLLVETFIPHCWNHSELKLA